VAITAAMNSYQKYKHDVALKRISKYNVPLFKIMYIHLIEINFHIEGRTSLIFYLISGGWSGTQSTVTAAIYWPIVPALDGRW
jgi:hypothetical protein